MIQPKPYLLKNKIQHYAWGTKNENAFIPKFLKQVPERDQPYAELWIGAHPKAPSTVILDDSEESLDTLIDKYPKEILGEKIVEKYGTQLPYLLKILSSERALSIQAHPDKELAKKLHSKDSKNYPDENHKPEIAIALDGLKALVGFKSFKEIIEIVDRYSALKIVFSNQFLEKMKSSDESNSQLLKELYSILMRLDIVQLEKTIEGIKKQIKNSNIINPDEREFIEQYKVYGVDVGLLSLLLFNSLDLNPGEAIFTDAGIPHAYLKGNIIECMANSDNVVRAGLTTKFKDVEVLLDMLNYDDSPVSIIRPVNSTENIYKTPAKEFELSVYSFSAGQEKQFSKEEIIIGLIMDGDIDVFYNNDSIDFEKGNSFMIPAILNNFTIRSNTDSQLVIVRIPTN